MQSRVVTLLALIALVAAGCGSGSDSDRAVPTGPPPTNDDGSPVTDIFTAQFDPAGGVLPFPTNLLLQGTTDLTINIPVADPTDFSNPQVALNALDGFSTTTATTTTFNGRIDPNSVVPGASVRMFKVQRSPAGAVTGVINELVPGVDYTAVVAGTDPTGRTLAVAPLRPLDQLNTYMVVVTRGVAKDNGTNATPDQTYFLAKRREPLATIEGGQCTGSTDPLLPAATACALEPLRQLTNAQELSAAAAGVNPDDIVVSWSYTTQSIGVVSQVLASTVEAQQSLVAPTGANTQIAGLGGLADIYVGAISLPYYLEAPTQTNPLGPIRGFWEAEPGAYTPDFAPLGLDPTSTNLTFANPLPVRKSTQMVPLMVTVPNEQSGTTRPAAGWPVVIYYHGITRNRTDMLALADTMALQGFAVIAMDQPLHGITDRTSPFYAGNLPPGFPPVTERTFDVNYTNPENPDAIDPSGTHFINLQSLLTTRDNNRQSQIDLSHLAATVPTMDINFDGVPDFDGSRVHFIGQSLGSINGIPFLAINPTVNVAGLSVPGGTLAPMLIASPTFGPQIRAGLAQAGVEPDSPEFFSFIGAAQTVTDSGDPINYAAAAGAGNAVLLHAVVGGPDSPPDQVIPNTSPFSPLAGTEPLIRVMGLEGIDSSVAAENGVRAATRFIAGDHGSLLNPSASVATTVEMQSQFASLVATDGRQVLVSDASVILSQ